MTVFASLSLGCALPPLAALATLSNLPAASTALGLPAPLLAGSPWRCWP
jgi:phosphatidylglycerol lysyltransferase